MMVTGLPKWHLAVLVLGVDFLTFEIPRDEEDILALMRAEEAFWAHVLDRTPPPVSGLDCDTKAILSMHPDSCAGQVDLFGREAMLDEYEIIGQRIKELEQQKAAIQQQICLDMGDFDSGLAGKWRVSWKSQERRTFDHKRFATDHPGVDLSGYYKISKSRPFKVI